MRPTQRVLHKLLEAAQARPRQWVSTRLTNNLRVELLLDEMELRLQISRSSVYPSRAEWATIMKNWPFPPVHEPGRFHSQGRCYLCAVWREIEMPLFFENR